jgi:hypothetical protein
MRNLSAAVSGAMLGALALGGAAHAAPSQPGPYYAVPSWDQQLPTSTRFVVLTNWANAAVLDRETGLVWQQDVSAASPIPWADAIFVCQGTSIGGRFGWRLAAVEELTTLLDPTTIMLFSGAPFNLGSNAVFWTATTDAMNTSQATDVDFGVFGGLGNLTKTSIASPWCVRGYQGTQSPQ